MNIWEDIDKLIEDKYLLECKNRIGATFSANNNKTGKGILIMGFNPAGDEKDVSRENGQENQIYVNYVEGNKGNDNQTYFKPIFELCSKVFNYNCKWDWCHVDLAEAIKKENEAVKNFYESHKDKQITVYTGELFYIHQTHQSELLKYFNFNNWNYIKKYVLNSLNAHLDVLLENGVDKLIIYINNALASKWIIQSITNNDDIEYMSHIIYKYKNHKFNIVFGSMLSGQRAMDVYSRERLIEQLRYLSKDF